MAVELYITRAEFWADNEQFQIGRDEWLAYVAHDPELRLRPENGPCFVEWIGPSQYDQPWLDWASGNISTKWPGTALYGKMLRIAEVLNAHIQDDEGNSYSAEGDWVFDPTSRER